MTRAEAEAYAIASNVHLLRSESVAALVARIERKLAADRAEAAALLEANTRRRAVLAHYARPRRMPRRAIQRCWPWPHHLDVAAGPVRHRGSA